MKIVNANTEPEAKDSKISKYIEQNSPLYAPSGFCTWGITVEAGTLGKRSV